MNSGKVSAEVRPQHDDEISFQLPEDREYLFKK